MHTPQPTQRVEETVGRVDALEVAQSLQAKAMRGRPVAGMSFQPAQPTTFGRRICLWIQDLLLDLEECEARDREQLDALVSTLREKGYSVTSVELN